MARLNDDGSLDTSFNSSSGTNNTVHNVRALADGKVLIVGGFNTYQGTSRPRIARINANGTLDTSFDPAMGFNSAPDALQISDQGQYLVAGDFTSYSALYQRNRIARLNVDGTLDMAFEPGAGAFTWNGARVDSIVRLSDGKYVIGGDFIQYGGANRQRVAKVNADGTVDTSFVTSSGANNRVYAVRVQSDGKVYIAGDFTSYAGTGRNRIARINTDGTLDTSFNPGAGFPNVVYALAIQSDDKVFAGGEFTTFNGTSAVRIVRINTDGTIDGSFDTGTGVSGWNVLGLGLQEDGRLLIGGGVTGYNGTSRSGLVRVNSDGTIDAGFVVGSGFSGGMGPRAFAFQQDGKILVAGWFNQYNGVNRQDILRLNPNGSLDTSIFGGVSFGNSGVWDTGNFAVRLHSDGRIGVGGTFGRVNGNMSWFQDDIGSAPNSISVGNLRTANLTFSSFDALLGYYGDANENSAATLWYCSETASPGCDPQSGPGQASAAMTAPASVYNGDYTVTINSGLTSGHTYNIRVIVTDTDGVTGSPVDGQVILP